MGKKKRIQQEQDVEGQHDILAWGKSRKQYYQQKQDQYSSMSEEYAEGKEIYDEQFNNLNEEDFYNPQEEIDSQEGEESEKQAKNQISQEYLKSQIKFTLALVQKFSQIDDEFSQLRKRLCDTYLLILLSLKECKVPYIDQHPILTNLSFLKKGIQHFASMLEFQDFEEDEGLDEEFDEQQEQDFQNQFAEEQMEVEQEKQEGLQIYKQYQKKKKQEKKQKKESKKAELKKKQQEIEPFKKVKQNEGRLINEKISKNKGLMKKRKKINGNSRVVLRKKYADKMKKMRSKGKVIRENPGNYQGQPTIRFGRKAGVKLQR